MKKLLAIFFAVLILEVPLAMRAEIEATAGSMKVGVHMDLTYRWSGESNKHPGYDEMGWVGYDTFSAGDLMIQISGMVGDRISYKILEGLVYGTFEPALIRANVYGEPDYWSTNESGAIIAKPATTEDGGLLVAPLEAYVDFKIIDQLKTRLGKFIAPTLLANTGVHMADVIHTANPPLIADRGMGFNEMNINAAIGWLGFPRVWLPLDVTGAGLIGTPLQGLEVGFFAYDEWIAENDVTGAFWGDRGYDFNRTKGWDIAATYNHDILGGKFTGRAFYFDEYLDFHNIDSYWSLGNGRNNGWGVGVMYDHNLWFVGAEYTADTLKWDEKPYYALMDWYIDKKSNTWSGFYVIVGGRFMGGTLQPVYRFDYIDYTSLKDDEVYVPSPKITSFDTEMWHTLGLNYLVNDNATVGLNYVIKQPEEMEDVHYPNINEIVVMLELDLL